MKRIGIFLAFTLAMTSVSAEEIHSGLGVDVPHVRAIAEPKQKAQDPDQVLLDVAKADKRVGIYYGKQDPRVCKQSQDQSDWLAALKLPGELYSWDIAHHGNEARSNALIGDMVGSQGFHANEYKEIVTEAFPTDDMAAAAQECIDNWYNSPEHQVTLVDKTAGWSCLTMTRSTNPNNSRWYCVGIALYYR